MTQPRDQRHTGTVRRGALRQLRQPRSPSSVDVRAGWIAVVAALILAGVAFGWLLGGGRSGGGGAPGGTEAAGGPATPIATEPPSLTIEEPSPTITTPTPSPTRAPTSTSMPTLRPTPEPTPQLAGLVIDFPADGEVVGSRRINVIGTAPPGATVTRDIPFWFDDHTTAGDDGLWMMPVELAEGENRLAFRVGDDPGTAQVLVVTYQPPP